MGHQATARYMLTAWIPGRLLVAEGSHMVAGDCYIKNIWLEETFVLRFGPRSTSPFQLPHWEEKTKRVITLKHDQKSKDTSLKFSECSYHADPEVQIRPGKGKKTQLLT